MRVMIVSCSYLLYEYLLKLKKIVLGLVILSSASALASWFCPRPRPRPQEFGLDQHHWLHVCENIMIIDYSKGSKNGPIIQINRNECNKKIIGKTKSLI